MQKMKLSRIEKWGRGREAPFLDLTTMSQMEPLPIEEMGELLMIGLDKFHK